MKIVIEPWTQEVLWGFAKMGIKVSPEYQCKKCGEWVKISTVEVENPKVKP